jgi:hypothetical protein
MTPAPPPATPTAGVAITDTQTMAAPTAGTIIAALSPAAMMTPTPFDLSSSIGGRPGLPRTGAGEQSALDLWMLAALAALLIGDGVLLLKRRTA